MGKGGDSQTVTQTLDPASQKYVQGTRGIAQRGARDFMAQDPSTMLLGPTAMWQQGVGGLQNLGFGPSNVQSWLNPALEQSRGLFDYQRGLASNQAAQQATGAGAFGGSRGAILDAQMQGDVNRAEQQYNIDAWNQAVQHMFQGGQLGLQRAGGLMQAGEYERALQERQAQGGLWQTNQALALRNLGLGPTGMTSSQPQSGSPLGGAMGGALAGFGVGGPVGAVLGGLGGLFG